jgi:linoleoyl-CoA desaturase
MTAERRRRLTYTGDTSFQQLLRARVDKHFELTGRSRRDVREWYWKMGTILFLFASSYTALVFFVSAWWQAIPLAIVLGFSVSLIGFNIMHDGGHGAVSRHRFVNRLMAHSVDLVGGSSYLWRWKHNVLHHHFSNITGQDNDIAAGPLARFTPHQRRLAHQRWQHWYVWALYGLMAIKWQFFDDFRVLIRGKIGPHPIPRPRGADLAWLIVGKLVFFTLAFAIPLWRHPFAIVALTYVLFAVVVGLSLSVVFQLAHCVEDAEFPLVASDARTVDASWAQHQLATTVNFSRGSRLVTWLVGGLNYQIEHHLFPTIPRANMRAAREIVRPFCQQQGLPYDEVGAWTSYRMMFEAFDQCGRLAGRA